MQTRDRLLVILVDVDVNEATTVTAGRALEHGPSRRAMHERLKELRAQGGQADAILRTRPPSGGVIAPLGFAKLELEK